jgi:hypothetical protein
MTTACQMVQELLSIESFCHTWGPARFAKDQLYICLLHGSTLPHFRIQTEVRTTWDPTYFLPSS